MRRTPSICAIYSWVNGSSSLPRRSAARNSHRANRDTDGQEFPNDAAAREEARAVATDLSRNRKPTSDERLVVTDADGKVIHEEPLFRWR
ncbi:MAG: hypothetical protein WBW00_21035 [Pseudolabrys sp.]